MIKLNDLIIYKKSLSLAVLVYDLVRDNQKLSKDFSLCDQLKRACVSVAANISEGYLRTQKQFIYFLNIASGSTNEMVTLLTVVQFVYKINTNKLIDEYIYLGKQIISFTKRFDLK